MLWCLYWCQGILYPSDSIISQSIAMLILCMSLLFIFKYIISNHIVGFISVQFLLDTNVFLYRCRSRCRG